MQTFSSHIIFGNVILDRFQTCRYLGLKDNFRHSFSCLTKEDILKDAFGILCYYNQFWKLKYKIMYIQIAWVNFFSWLVQPFLAKNNLASSVKNLPISKFSLISQCVWFLEVDRKNISDRIYQSKVTGPSNSLNDNSFVGLLACKSHFTRSTFRKWQSANTQAEWRQVINYNPVGKYIFKTYVKNEINILVLLKVTNKDTKWTC